MTEPTAEQIEAERERARAFLRDAFSWEESYFTKFWGCDAVTKFATALARVRIEAHAAGRDEGRRFALFLVQDEIRVASTSRKKGMTQKELQYWDGRQETAQRVEKMLVDGRALRGRT